MIALLGFLSLLLAGGIVGFIASKLVDLRGDDPRFGIGLAMGVAAVAGWVYTLISGSSLTFSNIMAILVAAIVAALAMIVWHILRRRAPYDKQSVRRSY
jgi:uncharacterized membrane protein YeaQ/YmgE (transglycosylase-associated protein family)